MNAPNELTLNYGTRFVNAYELNASGTPAAVDENPYEGIQIKGSTAFELTIPEPRKIVGNGEDGVTQVVFLPPLDGASGAINQEASDPDLSALFDGTKVRTLGEATMIGGATDRQGFEPRVALICQQAARGLETGADYWHTYIFPSAQVVRQGSGMGQDKATTRYSVAPNKVDAHLWGTNFTLADDGYTTSQFVELWTNNRMIVTSFVGDGIIDTFNFPASTPSASTYATSTVVFVDGVKKVVTTDYTVSATGIVFVAAPAAAARIDVFREKA